MSAARDRITRALRGEPEPAPSEPEGTGPDLSSPAYWRSSIREKITRRPEVDVNGHPVEDGPGTRPVT